MRQDSVWNQNVDMTTGENGKTGDLPGGKFGIDPVRVRKKNPVS